MAEAELLLIHSFHLISISLGPEVCGAGLCDSGLAVEESLVSRERQQQHSPIKEDGGVMLRRGSTEPGHTQSLPVPQERHSALMCLEGWVLHVQ